jgi:NAD(P)-dependent dehydrogenase (short-subunit alcohol dehydrogenase family)
MSEKPLHGAVAVVAGATRGAGRGIAVSLGEAGATVYCTGRSTRALGATPGRPETIEETADLVTARGGKGIPIRVDHTMEAEVKALFDRIREEQSGRLDLLVNDIWGGDPLTNWQQPFWQHSLADGLHIQELAVKTHIITSYYGAPLMIERGRGLIIEITDGVDYNYRGNLYYSLAKVSTIHLAQAMAADLKPQGVTALALTPGFLRSEAVLDHFGVTEANWRDGAEQDPHFAASETPYYIGRVVAALAAEPHVAARTGQVLMSGDVAQEYGLTDSDGRQPNWRTYYASVLASK